MRFDLAVSSVDASTAALSVTLSDEGTAPVLGDIAVRDVVVSALAARCAAQSVTDGTATCTVSYASTGTYPVTATYTAKRVRVAP